MDETYLHWDVLKSIQSCYFYLTVILDKSTGLFSSELKLLVLLSVKAGRINFSHNVIVLSGLACN